MSEHETYLIKKRDLAEIVRTTDQGALEEFLGDPLPVIAGAITAYLAHPTAALGLGVRVAQSALQGRMYKQFHAEIKYLKEKGKLPDDFENQPNGFQSWTELLDVIDKETPDQERLDAIKAMFLAANQVNATDGRRMLGYQLFQIAKKLRSNDLLVLKEAYQLSIKPGGHENARDWGVRLAQALGHNLIGLVEHAEVTLVDHKLLCARSDHETRVPANRVTDLGKAFCEQLQEYHLAVADLKPSFDCPSA